MKSVWKYQLELTGNDQAVEMPLGSDVLECQIDPTGSITIWALVGSTDPESLQVVRWFVIRGTGHPIESDAMRWIGTVQQGPLVWHVFECLEVERQRTPELSS